MYSERERREQRAAREKHRASDQSLHRCTCLSSPTPSYAPSPCIRRSDEVTEQLSALREALR